jgi:tRNA threonylcarbamoyladenosine biosynthesis protein TsaE
VEETGRFARALAAVAVAGDFFALYGDLGTGKTTFSAAFCSALGIDPREVDSPSFVLQNRYEGRLPVFHFDAYRLESVEELLDAGLFDAELETGVSLLEWADRAESALPENALRLRFSMKGEGREVIFEDPPERFASAMASEDS